MTFQIICNILMAHYVSDFIMQTHTMAVNKSTSFKWLSYHCLTYTITLCLLLSFFSPIYAIINGVAHLLTDLITSKISSTFWQKEQYHNFFCVIGLDQIIHYATLFGTYYLLFNPN